MKINFLKVFIALFIISSLSIIVVYAYNEKVKVNMPIYDASVHAQLEKAIEDGDYDAWIKIRQENNLPMNGRMFQVINKENFLIYKELHDANMAGDFQKADLIKSELGLGDRLMDGKGQGCSGSIGEHNCKGDQDQGEIDHMSCPNYAKHHGLD